MDWINRALTSENRINNPDGTQSSVKTMSFESDGNCYVAPTIREYAGHITTWTGEYRSLSH